MEEKGGGCWSYTENLRRGKKRKEAPFSAIVQVKERGADEVGTEKCSGSDESVKGP